MNLEYKDLQTQHKVFADVIGIDNLIKLAGEFGGTQIYIPKISELQKNKRYELISEEFDGGNIKELAKKYNVSESTVYNIVRNRIQEANAKKRSHVIDGQINFIDYISGL